MLADCLLWEEFDVIHRVFGELADMAAVPQLAEWHRAAPGRNAFQACLDAAPCQITGHPNESAALAAIRAAF